MYDGIDMESADERDRVMRCIAGEQEAWRELIREYTPVLMRAAGYSCRRYGFSRHSGIAEESVQKLFRILWENDRSLLKSFEWHCSLSTWLVAMLLPICRDRLRSEQARGRREEQIGSGKTVEIPAPSRAAEDRELHEQVAAFLSALSEEDRRLVTCLYREDLTLKETSARTGLSVSGVAFRMKGVLEKLSRHLSRFRSILL